MRNPYHLRANMDRLWRQANSNAPGYLKLKALDQIVRELYAPTDRARQNQALCFAVDPYDLARHHLRDLYDTKTPLSLQGEGRGEGSHSLSPSDPLSLQGEGWGEGPPTAEEDTPEDDDDPL